MKRSHLLIMLSLVLTMLLTCAARTRISDIKQDTRKFHDKKVTVTGTVTNTITLPILDVGLFQVDDGTGTIWVKPKSETPFKDDRVSITGTIKVGISISGKSFGLILFESDDDEY